MESSSRRVFRRQYQEAIEAVVEKEEADETSDELGVVESPYLGQSQLDFGWAPGAAPLTTACINSECVVCCGIVNERAKCVSLDLLHRCLAHFDPKMLESMVSQNSVDVRLHDHRAHTRATPAEPAS